MSLRRKARGRSQPLRAAPEGLSHRSEPEDDNSATAGRGVITRLRRDNLRSYAGAPRGPLVENRRYVGGPHGQGTLKFEKRPHRTKTKAGVDRLMFER